VWLWADTGRTTTSPDDGRLIHAQKSPGEQCSSGPFIFRHGEGEILELNVLFVVHLVKTKSVNVEKVLPIAFQIGEFFQVL